MSLDHGTKVRKHLASLCKGWGGELIRLRPKEFDALFHAPEMSEAGLTPWRGWHRPRPGYYNAPFTGERLGIQWEKKQVIYSGLVLWPGIIHEMGHVFMDLTYEEPWTAPEPGEERDGEFIWFGWEYVMTRKVGGNISQFYDHNVHYGVEWEDGEDNHCDFGHVRDGGQRVLKRFWAHAIEKSKEAGCLDENHQPKALR